VTVDFETVEDDNAVTIRDRDSMRQERVSIDRLVEAIDDQLQLD
jgi:glycyl-tRNA synthetase